ncbi:hypothetical protein H6F76_18315 [Leptolyngbya sp. FACHB-321]|uniref:hypothetical protein n=1 Tax=Leptolyngbya sp. FACHB-321 TaxID=2692807 RepID=UPI0016875DE2|nr:hypothetical protein [Leptolyngbya sp. FACHB-321]MBD2036965.1 hypothetical protein [Leptolyngbya sp. FACHB-321]
MTDQEQWTYSPLMTVLSQPKGLTRNELMQASNGTLTEEPVRRPTEKLICKRQV